jgi:hypothetical protein
MENLENANDDDINKYDKERIDKLRQQAANRSKYKKEMMADTTIQKYFEEFHPSSIEGFVDHYSRSKVSWKEHGPNWRKIKHEEEEQWINAAFEHLGYIQQKKLFDLQCIWRADQIKVPDMEITWDFRMWEHQNILACSFIEPVTEADIDLYQSYLLQNNKEIEDAYYSRWQDYESIKKEFVNDESLDALPEWYQFHNNRTGKGILLQLPDIRGEKEKFYSNLWFSDKKATQDKPIQTVTYIEERPFLSAFDDDFVRNFVETFESKEVRKWYKDYTYGHDYNDAYETMDENIRFLLSTGETIAIEANNDWIKAVEQMVLNYKTRKLSEALWQALEQYQFTLQSGLGFSTEKNKFDDIRKMFAEHILTGRKLNGEPEDFDF